MNRPAILAALVVLAGGAYALWQRRAPVAQGVDTPTDYGMAVDPLDASGATFETVTQDGTDSTDSGMAAEFFSSLRDNAVSISRTIFGTPYDDLISSSAAQYGIPAQVLYKLLYQESRFRPDIISGKTKSPVGALGIAQFMPATAAELGIDPLDPAQAIPGAARYLAQLRSSLGGDLTKAVAAYNWGIGNVKRKGLARAPAETVNYALNILGVKIA